MEKLHFRGFRHALILLQFSFLALSASVNLNPHWYFINCGSRNPNIELDGRIFVGDETSDHISMGNSKTIRIQKSSSPETIYQTARLYKKPSSFELKIEVNGTYLIDLSEGVFNISARHFLFLSNFRVRNSFSLPVISEYFLDISPGEFQIDFAPESSSFAFVNAIEVLLLPPNFTVDYALAVPPVAAVPNSRLFYGVQSNDLQTVYRLNVGGEKVRDTGAFWRTWALDDDYIVSDSFADQFLGDKYSTLIIAPDSVYRSCRFVKSTGVAVTNFTWRFPVKRNARHLVRLHFCDIVNQLTHVDFGFNVYIYSQFNLTVWPSDIVSKSSTPFFYDLVVDSETSGYLDVSIGPREDSYKQIAFLNGLEVMQFVSSKNFQMPSYKKKNNPPFVVVGSVCGAALVIILIAVFCIGWRGKSHDWIIVKPGYTSSVSNLNLKLKMPFAEILSATHNFDTKLLIGEGGFGKVYKGTLGGGLKVAVKRSDSSHGQGIYEFQTEVLILSNIRYSNLVSLIGYCDDGNEMILVYEFMEKGNLRDHLYNWKEIPNSRFKPSVLTWKRRLEICIGSAKGLHYLHTCSDGRIIHRDVKSTNILLDEDYVAKLADFRLSRSGPSDTDHFSTDVKGSFGYIDPEYFKTCQLTDKSDVYSFGVVLLEILCARLPIINSPHREEINLAEWGMYWLNKGQLEKIVDPLLVGQIKPNSLKKFGEIAEKCLKREGADRPTMLDVWWDLEYVLMLQQTTAQRKPDEDSSTFVPTNIAFPLQHVRSNIFMSHEGGVLIEGDGVSKFSVTSALSQQNIDGAR